MVQTHSIQTKIWYSKATGGYWKIDGYIWHWIKEFICPMHYRWSGGGEAHFVEMQQCRKWDWEWDAGEAKSALLTIWMSYQTQYWLHHNDHVCCPIQCTGTLAVHGFIQHVTNRSETEVVIIGADCSVASQPLANLAQFWNLVQVRHKYMSIIILYIGFHLQSSIIPMICLHTGINSFYISSIVWWEQLPHFPAPCSPWQQYSTRDCKTDAAFWLEAYCHHYSRGRHIYSGIYINTI